MSVPRNTRIRVYSFNIDYGKILVCSKCMKRFMELNTESREGQTIDGKWVCQECLDKNVRKESN